MLKIAHDKLYKHTLKENHRFPMIKYEMIPEQLINEGTCNMNNFFVPGEIEDSTILLTHDRNYYYRLINQELNDKEKRAIGFPMSDMLVKREKKLFRVQLNVQCMQLSMVFQ